VRLEPSVPLAQLGLKHGGAGCIGFTLSAVAEPLPGEWPGNLALRPHLTLAPVIFRLVSPQNAGCQNVNYGENLNGLRRTFGRPSSNVLVNPILYGF
jgi:hypothetical protein